ncbi:hypothetical protein JA1_004189 [Spathaspora sp. JA1]|nr:hypothetical protein JA1_004189 [Spathaspora sp. JA1]
MDFNNYHAIQSRENSPMNPQSPHYGGTITLSSIDTRADTPQYKTSKDDRDSIPVTPPPTVTSIARSPDPPEYPHSFHAPNSSKSPQSRLITSPTPSNSDNKICQWYCCSCGQSYGSVLYKDSEGNLETREEHQQKNSNSDSNNNYILDNLRYYSQVVYRDHINNSMATNISQPSSSSNELSRSNYNDSRPAFKTTLSEPIYSDFKSPKPAVPNYTLHTPPGPIPHFDHSTPMMSPTSTDLQNGNTIDYQERIILSVPTRFTCHRCNHMMCPYCPKLRLKDLDH